MASRGATNPSTTTLTHQPHSTRVYHHTIIVQPNTVNREGRAGEGGNIDTEQVGSKGRGGGGRRRIWSYNEKNNLVYAHVSDRCLHDDTIHNHKTFSLSSKPRFHWERRRDKTNGGRAGGAETSMRAASCSQHQHGGCWNRHEKQVSSLAESCWAPWLFHRFQPFPPQWAGFLWRICSAKVLSTLIIFTSDAFCIIIPFYNMNLSQTH